MAPGGELESFHDGSTPAGERWSFSTDCGSCGCSQPYRASILTAFLSCPFTSFMGHYNGLFRDATKITTLKNTDNSRLLLIFKVCVEDELSFSFGVPLNRKTLVHLKRSLKQGWNPDYNSFPFLARHYIFSYRLQPPRCSFLILPSSLAKCRIYLRTFLRTTMLGSRYVSASPKTRKTYRNLSSWANSAPCLMLCANVQTLQTTLAKSSRTLGPHPTALSRLHLCPSSIPHICPI